MDNALKVGIAGLGTVGASVVRMLQTQRQMLSQRCGRPIDVVAVSARSRGKDRGIDLKRIKWAANPAELAGDPSIDVFVELMGGDGDPAHAAVAAALKSGKSVVTANKALLARHGVDIDLENASYFLGRRSIVSDGRVGLPEWQDHIYISMARSAANANDFFRIPYNRVVELGIQLAV